MKDIKEAKLIKLMNDEFGMNVESRIAKFKEESKELVDAADDYFKSIKEFECNQNSTTQLNMQSNFLHMIDEMSDAMATLVHFQSLFGVDLDASLDSAIDKISKRKINPNYKR